MKYVISDGNGSANSIGMSGIHSVGNMRSNGLSSSNSGTGLSGGSVSVSSVGGSDTVINTNLTGSVSSIGNSYGSVISTPVLSGKSPLNIIKSIGTSGSNGVPSVGYSG